MAIMNISKAGYPVSSTVEDVWLYPENRYRRMATARVVRREGGWVVYSLFGGFAPKWRSIGEGFSTRREAVAAFESGALAGNF